MRAPCRHLKRHTDLQTHTFAGLYLQVCAIIVQQQKTRALIRMHPSLSLYLGLLAIHHGTEVVFVAIFTPQELGLRCALLPRCMQPAQLQPAQSPNKQALTPRPLHAALLISKSYCVAQAAALLEFSLWRWLGHPLSPSLTTMGALLAVAGESLRKASMVAAGPAFTHTIQIQLRPAHTLCTTGPYAILRHPGYAGWYLWTIGLQLLLNNLLCAFVFAMVASRVFQERIAYEEQTLVALFGQQYIDFAQQRRILIPFVSSAIPV